VYIEVNNININKKTGGSYMAKRKILLVSNDSQSSVVLEELLQDEGYECLWIQNPDNALIHLETEDIDLVICDLKFYELGKENEFAGIELYDQMKDFKIGVPILLRSSYGIKELCEILQRNVAYVNDNLLDTLVDWKVYKERIIDALARQFISDIRSNKRKPDIIGKFGG
jgi:CheY-like chemotaxis protein